MKSPGPKEETLNRPPLLSATAIGRWLKLDPGTVRAMAAANGLETITTGRRELYRTRDIERLVGESEIRENA
jgi:hypothetical protein